MQSTCYTSNSGGGVFQDSFIDQTDICKQSLSCLLTVSAVAVNTDSRRFSLCHLLSRQVGEIEEQLAAARREVTKSEEANQKLQREVKEVCWASLSLPGQDPELSQYQSAYLNP